VVVKGDFVADIGLQVVGRPTIKDDIPIGNRQRISLGVDLGTEFGSRIDATYGRVGDSFAVPTDRVGEVGRYVLDVVAAEGRLGSQHDFGGEHEGRGTDLGVLDR